MAKDHEKNYNLKPMSKPLQKNTEGQGNSPQFRDITEDDDGYHPYADRIEPTPLFEENPWD